jgi:hypothetical protein
MKVWVGDLDAYIDIDGINRVNQREAEEDRLEYELDEIGDLPLLAGKAISARHLNYKGILPSDWRHAVHQAEITIGTAPAGVLLHTGSGRESPEARFLRAMLDLGRPYAVARYARWERLDYPSAVTATLSHGIRALVNQFLVAEAISRSRSSDERIRGVLGHCEQSGIIAYRRTGLLQAAIHRIADETPGHPGGAALDRGRTRTMLALARLHFSIVELRAATVGNLHALLTRYDVEREAARSEQTRMTSSGRIIRAWRLRHVRPLLDLYPYAVRHGLARAVANLPVDDRAEESAILSGTGGVVSRTALVNELALARCGILRMRRAGRDRTRST